MSRLSIESNDFFGLGQLVCCGFALVVTLLSADKALPGWALQPLRGATISIVFVLLFFGVFCATPRRAAIVSGIFVILPFAIIGYWLWQGQVYSKHL